MVSIIIVTYNSEDYIADCLDSISKKTSSPYEIIVVDNHSGDRTVGIIKKKFPYVKLVCNYENKNFAYATNQGMNIAKGRYILILNPDTVLKNNGVDILDSFLDKRDDIGAVAPKLLNLDGSVQRSVRDLPAPYNLWTEITGLAIITRRVSGWKLPNFDYGKTQEAPQPSGSAFLIRGELLRDIGGLNEKYPLYINDVELCREIKRRGQKIYYLKDAEVYHRRGSSTELDKSRSILYWHFGMIRYLREHFPYHPVIPLYVIILLCGMFYRTLICRLKLFIKGGV